MKGKDVLNDIVPAAFTILPDAAKETMLAFQDEMKAVCTVYDVYFRDPLDRYKDV